MNTFSKAEHLCSRSLIDRLYAEGQRFVAFPFSVHWLEVGQLPEEVPCQVLIAVPKRKLKHAVSRNRVKRLSRECYRLRKAPLHEALQAGGKRLVVSLNYIHTEVLTYQQMSRKFDKLMAQLISSVCSSGQES